MIIALLVIHMFVTVAMIGLILLQKSDGSGPLGIGGGSTNSLFTARGVANILTRATAILATLFIGNCLLIGILTNQEINKNSKLFSQTSSVSSSKKDANVEKSTNEESSAPNESSKEPAKEPEQK